MLCVQVLKETLIRHGFIFESDTDTEVIPKLAKFVFDKARDGEGIMFLFCNSVVVAKSDNIYRLILMWSISSLV
jgi:glucosamine--fructose-6-phosphate aminotransferase (isomerizing)